MKIKKIDLARQLIESGISEEAKAALEKEFPELKESEDERIRKSIVSIIDQYARMCEIEGDPCKASLINDALAYLEKQKEQKPVKFSVGDYVKDTNYQGEPIYEIVQMDSECYICEYRGPKSIGDRAIMHFSFNNPYLRIVPKPSEWSEEDKRDIQWASDVFERIAHVCDPQIDISSAKRISEKLKSLCSQPHWKPSEEQSKEEAIISDTDKINLRSAVKIIRNSNHPFKENLALTLEKYIER